MILHDFRRDKSYIADGNPAVRATRIDGPLPKGSHKNHHWSKIKCTECNESCSPTFSFLPFVLYLALFFRGFHNCFLVRQH